MRALALAVLLLAGCEASQSLKVGCYMGRRYCEHYACRCIRAEELSEMADYVEAHGGSVLQVSELRATAVQVHEGLVPCREEAEGK